MSTIFPVRFAWYPFVAADGRLLGLYRADPHFNSPVRLVCIRMPTAGGTARKMLRVTTRSPGMDKVGTAISGLFTGADSDLYKS